LSDLGEISAELRQELARLERLLLRFAEIDRAHLAALQSQLERTANGRPAAAMVAQARQSLRQAAGAAAAARRAGAGWLAQHGSGEPGGSSGFSTPGGRAYYPPEEAGHRTAAANLPPFPGEYTLDAHGDSEHVFVGGQPLSAADVVELIEADTGWGRRPIRLFSCNTGHGQEPIAAEIADLARVRVTAPAGIAWSSADGKYGVFPIEVRIVNGAVVEVPNRKREGSWREFDPR
jgi:hypothetical protein